MALHSIEKVLIRAAAASAKRRAAALSGRGGNKWQTEFDHGVDLIVAAHKLGLDAPAVREALDFGISVQTAIEDYRNRGN